MSGSNDPPGGQAGGTPGMRIIKRRRRSERGSGDARPDPKPAPRSTPKAPDAASNWGEHLEREFSDPGVDGPGGSDEVSVVDSPPPPRRERKPEEIRTILEAPSSPPDPLAPDSGEFIASGAAPSKKDRGRPRRPPSAGEDLPQDLLLEKLADQQAQHENKKYRGGRLSPRAVQVILTVLVVLAAGFYSALPVVEGMRFEAKREKLQGVVEAQLRALQGNSERAKALEGWIKTRDLPKVRDLYREHREKLVEALKAAGFPASYETVALRYDDKSKSLILSAFFDEGERMLVAGARTGRFGRGLKPYVDPRHTEEAEELYDAPMETAMGVFAMAVILVFAIWLLPWLRTRRQGTV